MTAPSTDRGVLERFIDQVVVDDYAAVEAADPSPSPSHTGARIGAIAVALVIGLVIAVTLLAARADRQAREGTREALAARISTLSATVDERRSQIEERSAAVESLQATLLDSERATSDTEQRDRLAALAATAPMSGPGVTVTLDDAADARAGSLNRVLDRDLQDVVNALWRAGATGVAINGQRLTADTAIRSAGQAILVNYQPLNHPYTVEAVGASTDRLAGLSRLLTVLKDDYGLTSGVTSGDVALPPGELRQPRFATTGQGAAS